MSTKCPRCQQKAMIEDRCMACGYGEYEEIDIEARNLLKDCLILLADQPHADKVMIDLEDKIKKYLERKSGRNENGEVSI